ncbi:MAG: hypothetical protein ACREL5_13130, partial [Gemmatimonadales bacterium]
MRNGRRSNCPASRSRERFTIQFSDRGRRRGDRHRRPNGNRRGTAQQCGRPGKVPHYDRRGTAQHYDRRGKVPHYDRRG